MTGLLPILNIDSNGEHRRSVVLWGHIWPFLWFAFIVIHFILLFSYGSVEAEPGGWRKGKKMFEMRGWWHLHMWHDAASSGGIENIWTGLLFSFHLCTLFFRPLSHSRHLYLHILLGISVFISLSLSLIQSPPSPNPPLLDPLVWLTSVECLKPCIHLHMQRDNHKTFHVGMLSLSE